MADALWSVAIFALLCGAAMLGVQLIARLPALHRTRETLDFTRLVTGLLVTFAALVLGLLTASVNASFEKTGDDLQLFGARFIRLSAALEDYGPETRPVRAELRRYVAAAVASTWPEEPAPPGDYPKAVSTEADFDAANFGAVLRAAAGGVRALDPPDVARKALRGDCLAQIEALEDERWVLIGEAHHALSGPFVSVVLFWLVMIFLSFGLNAPRNALATTSTILVALCVAAAFFVLLELDGPLDGLVKVSSEPLRHALRHLDASLAANR